MKTALVALGGNSLLRPKDDGTAENQYKRMKESCVILADMIDEGYDLVFTHGNGPQVGNILLQNEISSKSVPPMPLDICVAQSQGQIGYIFQQVLNNELKKRGVKRKVVSIITQVIVDSDDPAFDKPTKYIGPYYTKEEADKLNKKLGWSLKEDKKGQYRRVVPSPKPKGIVESDVIKALVFSGLDGPLVISAGGGGVPVLEKEDSFVGVEGVIDKDLASAVLAADIDEEFFIMLTRVDHVYLDFGTIEERKIHEMNIQEAERYLEEGQFPPGSMGPKIEASIHFLKKGGKKVLITSPEKLSDALDGDNGTYIYP